jgi:hypothetical protein
MQPGFAAKGAKAGKNKQKKIQKKKAKASKLAGGDGEFRGMNEGERKSHAAPTCLLFVHAACSWAGWLHEHKPPPDHLCAPACALGVPQRLLFATCTCGTPHRAAAEAMMEDAGPSVAGDEEIDCE